HFIAGVERVNVHRYAATDISRWFAPKERTSLRVVQFGTARMTRMLMNIEDFQPWPLRIDVRQVQGVPMSPAGAIQPFAVVVDHASTVDDFVAAVAIDVANAECVIPLPSVLAVARRPV